MRTKDHRVYEKNSEYNTISDPLSNDKRRQINNIIFYGAWLFMLHLNSLQSEWNRRQEIRLGEHLFHFDSVRTFYAVNLN